MYVYDRNRYDNYNRREESNNLFENISWEDTIELLVKMKKYLVQIDIVIELV